MPKIRKKTSKRIGFREKYAVQKKVTAHHRKIRKNARKLKKTGAALPLKGSSKRNVIPNSFPGKEEFVNEMERMREYQLEMERKAKEKKLDVKIDEEGKQVYNFTVGETGKSGDDIVRQESKYESGLTNQEIAEAEELIDPEGVQAQKLNTISKKSNWRDVKKAIEMSDVVIQVLDARDPEGTRSQMIEELIEKEGKKLIFVLNKVDLVPQENLKAWKKYYKNQKKLAVSFQCNQMFQKSKDEGEDAEMDGEGEEKPQSLQEKAIEQLMGYLFKYARAFAEKKEQELITVAIVGYANVGKSSLINVLRKKIVVNTSSNAFLTRSIKQVKLNNSMVLVDTPGILSQGILTEKDGEAKGSADESQQMRILRSALQVDELTNPEKVIPSVLAKVDRVEILRHYRIAQFDTVEKLLELVAMKKGLTNTVETTVEVKNESKKKKKSKAAAAVETQVKKEMKPDLDQAARRVLRDFLQNRLSFHSKVPDN